MQLNYRSQETNLHSFWDTGIISSQNITLADCLNFHTYTPEELKAIRKRMLLAGAENQETFLYRFTAMEAGIHLAVLQLFFKAWNINL